MAGLTWLVPSAKESRDIYTYDPRNPVPTIGGAMLGKAAGIAKQNETESRSDVLVFTTPVLKDDVEVTGPIYFNSVCFYFSS